LQAVLVLLRSGLQSKTKFCLHNFPLTPKMTTNIQAPLKLARNSKADLGFLKGSWEGTCAGSGGWSQAPRSCHGAQEAGQ